MDAAIAHGRPECAAAAMGTPCQPTNNSGKSLLDGRRMSGALRSNGAAGIADQLLDFEALLLQLANRHGTFGVFTVLRTVNELAHLGDYLISPVGELGDPKLADFKS
jgi:hypothetical protein